MNFSGALVTALHFFLATPQQLRTTFKPDNQDVGLNNCVFQVQNYNFQFHRSKRQIDLTPLESPWALQNLSVTLASWGMNLPTPFLKGAFAVIQPLFRKSAFAVILLATCSKQDHSETRRIELCQLVGKADILKWESACRTYD